MKIRHALDYGKGKEKRHCADAELLRMRITTLEAKEQNFQKQAHGK